MYSILPRHSSRDRPTAQQIGLDIVQGVRPALHFGLNLETALQQSRVWAVSVDLPGYRNLHCPYDGPAPVERRDGFI